MKRDLRVLLLADFILRLIGNSCYTLFVGAVYNLTGKAADVGFISAATVIPALLVALSAGKYTARLSPLGAIRWFMFVRSSIFAIASIAPRGLIAILMVAVFHSVMNQASVSAKMTLDAEVLTDDVRRTYNSRKTMLASMALITGLPIGAVAIEALGLQLALLITAVLSVSVPLTLSTLSNIGLVRSPCGIKVQTSALDSLKYLRGLPYITSIVAMYGLVTIILEAEAPLMFPFVDQVYKRGSDFTGLLFGLAGIGGVIGAMLAQKFPNFFTESSISWLIALDGLIFFTFTQLTATYLASALFTMLGSMGAITLVVVEGAVQKNVHSIHRPFAFSMMQFFGGAGGAALGILASFLAENYGAKPVLVWCAGIEIAAGLACLFGWLICFRSGKVPSYD